MNDTAPGTERFLNKRRTPYTMVANALLRDPRLSLKAKGLLAVMLSVPDDTTYRMSQVEAVSDDGRDAHRTALRELEAAGYLKRRQTRAKDGKLSDAEYDVSDDIRTVDGFSGDGKHGDGGMPVQKGQKPAPEVPPALLALPGWTEAWGAWLAYRRERKLPMPASTMKRQLALLTAQADPLACMEQSITNGWNGLFEVRPVATPRSSRAANSRSLKTAQDTYRAISEDSDNDPF